MQLQWVHMSLKPKCPWPLFTLVKHQDVTTLWVRNFVYSPDFWMKKSEKCISKRWIPWLGVPHDRKGTLCEMSQLINCETPWFYSSILVMIYNMVWWFSISLRKGKIFPIFGRKIAIYTSSILHDLISTDPNSHNLKFNIPENNCKNLDKE